MRKKMKRLFKVSDDKMLESADSILSAYVEDEYKFKYFDRNTFTESFKTEFKNYIDRGISNDSDEKVLDEIHVKTVEFKEKVKEGCDFFEKMKYNIEIAFPDNREMWNQFGYAAFSKIKKSRIKIVLFFSSLYKIATLHKEQMINAGFGEEKIERIGFFASELNNLKVEQTNAKRARPHKTRERVALLNTVWLCMVKINRAANYIFEGNAPRLKLFELPEPKN